MANTTKIRTAIANSKAQVRMLRLCWKADCALGTPDRKLRKRINRYIKAVNRLRKKLGIILERKRRYYHWIREGNTNAAG